MWKPDSGGAVAMAGTYRRTRLGHRDAEQATESRVGLAYAARVRVAAVADLHGHLPEVPRCELLLIAGDLCPPTNHDATFQAGWLDGAFRSWLDGAPAETIAAVAGNHDFIFANAPELVPHLRWTYLQDSVARINGVTIWGSPWTPWFHDWAFNAPLRHGEAFLTERYGGAPEDADILLLHGPPAGHGDVVPSGEHVGSTAALHLVDRVAPALCAYGHVHEGRGTWLRGDTQLANVAAVDSAYALRTEPVVIFNL
jgi:Icc-related predicted phosphoesterase